jgi:hypothetical protein
MFENNNLSTDTTMQQSEKNAFTILPQRLIKLCQPSRILWFAPLLGFILTIPSFFAGYSMDDHFFKQNSIEKSIFHQRPSWDYFNFVSSDAEVASYRERGIFGTWWMPDSYRFHLFRPLASLIQAFQFRFFANTPWIIHISVALLYALLIFVCAKVLMRFSSSPIALGIACLFFAIDDTHAYSTGWCCSHNTILCCIFGLIALLMHDRWRRQKSTRWLLLFIVSFLLALLASEGGLALMGYLFAYALFIENGNWRKKNVSMIPGAIITFGYMIFYTMQQLGMKDGCGYISPTDDLFHTMFIIMKNTAMFALSQILSFPPLTLPLSMSGEGGVVVAVVLLSIIIIFLRKFLVSSRIVMFFGTGMVLSIIPFTLGMMSDRLLFWAGIGAAGLLGELFTNLAVIKGKQQRIFAKILLFNNMIISIVFFIPTLFVTSILEDYAQALEKNVPTTNTILLNMNGISGSYPPAIRCEKGGIWPEHFYNLYEGPDTLTVKCTGERTLLATTPNGWFWAYIVRSTRSKRLYFKKNDTFDVQLMTATIVNVTDDGRPLSVRFTFKKDLADFAWIKWTKKEPEKCKVPVIGDEIQVCAPMF